MNETRESPAKLGKKTSQHLSRKTNEGRRFLFSLRRATAFFLFSLNGKTEISKPKMKKEKTKKKDEDEAFVEKTKLTLHTHTHKIKQKKLD